MLLLGAALAGASTLLALNDVPQGRAEMQARRASCWKRQFRNSKRH
jgi:hypothetical protein